MYAQVSPSIAFIETPVVSGSAVLIQDGYLVTNHHIVWPYKEVRVVFPDGTELANVPVAGWDPLTDLAVLGPVDVSAPPLQLEDGEDMALGEELFLVGYPAEWELTPQASITRGILSRYREWERQGITLIQTGRHRGRPRRRCAGRFPGPGDRHLHLQPGRVRVGDLGG